MEVNLSLPAHFFCILILKFPTDTPYDPFPTSSLKSQIPTIKYCFFFILFNMLLQSAYRFFIFSSGVSAFVTYTFLQLILSLLEKRVFLIM